MTKVSEEKNLRREFADRTELIAYLKQEFSAAAARSAQVSDMRGGRKAAEKLLQRIDPQKYRATRNWLKGEVTHLSPYIRHGVLTLAEVRDHALQLVSSKTQADKFVNELGWRDYWQRLYAQLGDAIWQDREAYKTGFAARDYADELPADISNGETGMACLDSFSRELCETGYLHNHARMWMAAYVVHWRKVKWQAGAKWFLEHLLDGDPASNNLSWQWVASAFSHKPYYFNRENLEKFTDGAYCRHCSLRGRCDFEGSYTEIERRLFPRAAPFDLPSSGSWNRPN